MKTPHFWRKKNAFSAALVPFSMLYRFGAWVDRATASPQRVGIPVISLGNATVGGSGKTPTTLALLPLLRVLGFHPHVLTRGYRAAHAKPMPFQVAPTDSPAQTGDEAQLLARAAPTWVGADRAAAARAAMLQGADLVLCDDAHQHYRLAKTLSLLIVDGPYGNGNGHVLPAGPLREPWHCALARADAVIVIGPDTQQLAAPSPTPVFHAEFQPVVDTAQLAGQSWLAFAGIGRPEKFFTTLRQSGVFLAGTCDFSDHHAYTESDLTALMQEAQTLSARLITTEKDWVKLTPAWQRLVTAFAVTLRFRDEHGLMRFLQTQLKPTEAT